MKVEIEEELGMIYPIYRAKYEETFIEGFFLVKKDKSYISNEDGEFEIDKKTLSLHLPWMMAGDSEIFKNGEKDLRIFASYTNYNEEGFGSILTMDYLDLKLSKHNLEIFKDKALYIVKCGKPSEKRTVRIYGQGLDKELYLHQHRFAFTKILKGK